MWHFWNFCEINGVFFLYILKINYQFIQSLNPFHFIGDIKRDLICDFQSLLLVYLHDIM